MKRRKRCANLSGSSAEHAERQREYLIKARAELTSASRKIQQHKCGDAADHLRRVHEAMGAYHAEVAWSGEGSKYGPEVQLDVRKTGNLFEQRCIVPLSK